MRIAIAADHNGVPLKAQLTAWLTEHGHDVDDRGTNGTATVDYPPLCADVGYRVAGGTPTGASSSAGPGPASRWPATRSAGSGPGVCHDVFTTQIARAHNDANVLIIGAKIVAPALAEMITELWMATAFKGGPHQQRLDQIAALERGEPLSLS